MSSATDLVTREQRSERVSRRLLQAGVALYLLFGASLVVLGRVTDSGALIAEGWHTAGDGLLSALLTMAAGLSARGADAEHPYGREKFEHLGAAILGGVLFVLAAEGVVDLVGHRASGDAHRPHLGSWATAILATVSLVRVAWVLVLRVAAQGLGSVAVHAEARHASADAAATALAGAAAVVGQWAPWVDVLGTIAIALVIAWTGITLVREHAPWLADRAVITPEEIARVLEPLGTAVPHRIRSRGTPRRVFVDLQLGVPPSTSVHDAALLGEFVAATLRAAHPNVVELLVQVVPARHESLQSP